MIERMISIGLIGMLIVIAGWSYLDRPEPVKTVAIHKLTTNSMSNSVDAVLNTHFKIPRHAGDIIWQDPKTGDMLTEVFILKNTPPAKHEAVFTSFEKKGIRRMLRVCRGITQNTWHWTLAYCTYTEAPRLKG